MIKTYKHPRFQVVSESPAASTYLLVQSVEKYSEYTWNHEYFVAETKLRKNGFFVKVSKVSRVRGSRVENPIKGWHKVPLEYSYFELAPASLKKKGMRKYLKSFIKSNAGQ